MQMHLPLTLLNHLTPEQFLAEYWQKKPLLIKQAIPDFSGLLSANELAGLACEEFVESRIIQYQQSEWLLEDGPFDEAAFENLPDKDWTLLVQSVNHFLPEAADLLKQFNFIPHARLDDLMVSYAPKGGSVGPHIDSYDVFLLQGEGSRRWSISTQDDHSFIADAPIKVLDNFVAEDSFVLEAGDMLYLPPHVAHWGVAESDDCMTYSIGFRAPKEQELAHAFLDFLQSRDYADNIYQDPDLTLQKNPAEVSAQMVGKVSESLKQITWDDQTVGQFLAAYLSEPKQHIVFEPNEAMTLAEFTQSLREDTLHLRLNTQMLFWQHAFYLNGERLSACDAILPTLQTLANDRMVQANATVADELASCLHQYYLAGFLELEGLD